MRKALFTAAAAVFLLTSGAAFAAEKPAAEKKERNDEQTYRLLNLFGDVFEQVRANYVDEVADDQLIEAAITGMLSSLDPHSSYMNAKSYKDMQVQTRGNFGGLGIEVSMENGVVKVVVVPAPGHSLDGTKPWVIRKGAGVARKTVVDWMTDRGFEIRPIVAGNFARNPVLQHMPHRRQIHRLQFLQGLRVGPWPHFFATGRNTHCRRRRSWRAAPRTLLKPTGRLRLFVQVRHIEPRRRRQPLHHMVPANRAAQQTTRLLIGQIVTRTKPALETVTMRAGQIDHQHLKPPRRSRPKATRQPATAATT